MYIIIPITWLIRNEKGLLEIEGVQKQIHRLIEVKTFGSSKAQDMTEHLNGEPNQF